MSQQHKGKDLQYFRNYRRKVKKLKISKIHNEEWIKYYTVFWWVVHIQKATEDN
jgi:choline-glycine betaine transporter